MIPVRSLAQIFDAMRRRWNWLQRNKQREAYVMALNKWMVEKGLAEITNKKKPLIKSYKIQVEGHDRLRPEETRHIERKKVCCKRS